MATRKMVLEGDETLRKKSRPVEKFDQRLATLLDDMAETLDEQSGVGLAGVQVGMLRRLFILDMEDGVTDYINPEILERRGEQDGPEGCLSCPGEWGMVTRPMFVRVRAQDRQGNWFEKEGEELFARAVCHEYDHLDGKIYKDIAERMMTQQEVEDYWAAEEGEQDSDEKGVEGRE